MRRLGSVLVAATMVIGSVLAAGPATATTGEPCADLNVSASPPIVPPGDTVTITYSVTNCGEENERIAVRARVTGPCGSGRRDVFVVSVPPGETAGKAAQFPAPGCEGDHLIRAGAGAQSVVLDRAVDTFKVCEPCQSPRR